MTITRTVHAVALHDRHSDASVTLCESLATAHRKVDEFKAMFEGYGDPIEWREIPSPGRRDGNEAWFNAYVVRDVRSHDEGPRAMILILPVHP
jgi:hypothetical protein